MSEISSGELTAVSLTDRLTLANIYSFKFRAERERVDDPTSFTVQVEPSYWIGSGRIDYLFDAQCQPLAADNQPVGIIEVAMIATFDALQGVDLESFSSETIQWFGGNVALFAAYPYIREAFQSHGSRLGMPNMTIDLLKRGEPLPDGLTIGIREATPLDSTSDSEH